MRALIFGVVIGSVFAISAVSAADQRGIWVVRQAFASQRDMDRFFQAMDQLQITDIYYQVRALGETFYSPAVPEPSVKIEPDWLEILLDRAHRRGMRVHAWLNVLYIWSGNKTPEKDAHIFNHSRVTVLRAAGDAGLPEYAQLRRMGVEGFFVDPQDDGNYYSISSAIHDLHDRYELDGFHLDYFRYPNFDYAFSPLNRAGFYLKYFIDPAKVYQNLSEFTETRGEAACQYIDNSFREFLSDRLTVLLQNLRRQIKTANAELQLTIAVKPSRSKARQIYMQPWDDWLDNGLCDGVLLMNYIPDYNEFRNNLKEAESVHDRKRIVIGIGLYNLAEDAIAPRLTEAGKSGFGGVALFSYNYLNEHRQLLSRLKPALTLKP
jgi:uncharacterized lipoprotein YddW (UPF0748 family)